MSRRHKSNPEYDKSVYRSLVLITQFGMNMLVPIGMMSALGIWLDNRYHTSFWTILLFFVGAVAGAQNSYRMAKKIYEADGAGSEEHMPKTEDARKADDQEADSDIKDFEGTMR